MRAKAIMSADHVARTRKIYQFPDYFLATFDTIKGRPRSPIGLSVDGVLYSRTGPKPFTLQMVIEDLKRHGYRRIA